MRTPLTLCLLLVAFRAESAIINRPYLQAVTQSSIYVLVECATAETVVVDYGFTSSYGYVARTESISPTTAAPTTYVHKIKLTGLTPDTAYHYRATQAGNSSEDSWFRTAKPPGRNVRFAWMADSRTNSTIFDGVTNLVSGKQPEFMLLGGDVCVSGAYSAWQTEFFRPNALALLSHVPFFFATGNHEGWATNAMAFTHAPSSPSNSQDYFSFDYGDLHVLVLDTEVSYAPGSPQYIFAQNDLGATRQTWKIVACHKPAYCSGGHGEDAGMITMTTNIFEPARVDLVIAGHSHFYQHNLVHNMHHLVVGTAGAPQYVPTTASYTLRSVQAYNYAIVDVTPTTLRLTVYSNTDATLDTLTLTKPPATVRPVLEGVSQYHLGQNYPNPFNPSTTIRFALPVRSNVTLTVFNTLGQAVATLVRGEKESGWHEAVFDASGLSSGVYFYRLRSGEYVETRKLMIVR